MDAKGYSRIPRELCYWITFLAEALLVGYHVIIFQKGAILCSEPARY